MKNRKLFVFYIISFVIVVFMAYEFYEMKSLSTVGKTIKTLDDKAFSSYKRTFDLNGSFGKIWGIKDEVKKLKIVKKEASATKISDVVLLVEKKDKLLCVKKNCYKFLGIYFKKEKPFITFASKNFKHGIKEFTTDENLEHSLYIKNITTSSLSIVDVNTSRGWDFKLFDVNITKYKPKDINETDF